MKCEAIKRDGNICGRRVKDGHDVCGFHTEEHRAKMSAAGTGEKGAKTPEELLGEFNRTGSMSIMDFADLMPRGWKAPR